MDGLAVEKVSDTSGPCGPAGSWVLSSLSVRRIKFSSEPAKDASAPASPVRLWVREEAASGSACSVSSVPVRALDTCPLIMVSAAAAENVTLASRQFPVRTLHAKNYVYFNRAAASSGV